MFVIRRGDWYYLCKSANFDALTIFYIRRFYILEMITMSFIYTTTHAILHNVRWNNHEYLLICYFKYTEILSL